MSRPQDAQRPLFSFGNPFRKISSKGSYLSPKLLAILNSFEERLAQRMRKLNPKSMNGVLSLSWMQLAMVLLCETHKDIKALIADLELPVCDWDDVWIDLYLNNSVKVLDICNAFSSQISQLNNGHILLQCALHNLDSTSPTQLMKSRASLDGWKKHISSRNSRVDSCCAILESLTETLNLPKVRKSAKGKVLMQAMYGVKVATVFVCSVFVAAFTGSSKKLTDLHVPETLLWAEAFTELQKNVNGGIRNLSSSGTVMPLKELEAVDTSIQKLYPMVQDALGPIKRTDVLQSSISDLRKSKEKLSQGLDILTKGVDGFFQMVLTGRDALICNLRTTDSSLDDSVAKNKAAGKTVT